MSAMQDIDNMPGWTEMGVTYRELAEMPSGQIRLIQVVADRCRREGLSLEESIEQIRWALNRPADAQAERTSTKQTRGH